MRASENRPKQRKTLLFGQNGSKIYAMAKLPCIREEFEQFKAFYDSFKRLIDQPQKVADFEYEKQKLLYNVEKLWPQIEELCKQFKIFLEREMSEERRRQIVSNGMRALSGKTNLPKPEFQPIRKESIDLALVRSLISSLTISGRQDVYHNEKMYGKSAFALRCEKINQILAAVLVHLSDNFCEKIGTKSSPEKPAETGPDIAPAKDKKKKAKIACLFKKIIGWIFKKTSHVIGAVIIAIIGGLIVAILVDIFADFGWIERIKAVIYKILQLN